MLEKEKREFIDKIVDFGAIKKLIGKMEQAKRFDVVKDFEKEKDQLLSDIIDIIKKL